SDTGSEILDPLVVGLMSDASSELKEYAKAALYYKKAADKNANSFTTPLMLTKLGLIYYVQQDYQQALNNYNKNRKKFPNSQEASTVDALIARVEAKL